MHKCSFEIKALFNITWEPDYFVVDFDQGMVKAILEVFKKVKIRFCYFHWKKAVLEHGRAPFSSAEKWKKKLDSELTRYWFATNLLNLVNSLEVSFSNI